MTKKIWIAKKLYRKLEVRAKEKGLASVDELVADIIKEFSEIPP
jgi:metal-responsive CopG/Arc/MetJ family transcriptional regulator